MATVGEMTTALLSRLSEDQRQRLAKLCCARISTVTGNLENMWKKRDNYLLQAEDKFDYRKTEGEKEPERPTAIFALQNDSLNVVGGMAQFLAARTIDDILGGGSYYQLQPQGRNDPPLARAMQQHSQWRIEKSNLKDVFEEAIELAYAIGEKAVKIIYAPKIQFSEREKNVLVGEDGKPVILENGKTIDEDDIVDDPETGAKVLKSDPTFPLPATLTFEAHYVPEETEAGEPLDAIAIHHRDLVIPTTARSVQESDFVAHLADYPLSVAKRKWNIPPDLIAKITAGQPNGKADSAEKKARDDSDEEEETIPNDEEFADPLVNFAEVYIETMINGRKVKLLCIVSTKTKDLIWGDYLANVTPGGVVPIFVVRPFPVPNRWYGRGMFEIYAYAQEFIERHLNYIAYRNRLHANPIKLIRAKLLKDYVEGEELKAGPDNVFRIDEKAEGAPITFLEYPDLDSRTWELMQMMIQMLQLRTGVTSASQGGIDSVPQNSTATGIEAILNSGHVLSRRPIASIKKAIKEGTLYAIQLLYSNYNEEEIVTYLEGENAMLLKLSPEQIKGIEYDINLTMTKFREREAKEKAQESIAAFQTYLQIPEEEKEAARPMFVEILRGNGMVDADRIIRMPRQPEPPGPAPL